MDIKYSRVQKECTICIEKQKFRSVLSWMCINVSVAQWIRRETTNLEIAGSSPVGDRSGNFLIFLILGCNEDGVTLRRS